MIKILGVILLAICAFVAGLFLAFYFHIQHTFVGSLFAKIVEERSLPFKVRKNFNGNIYYVTDRKQMPNADGTAAYLDKYGKKVFYGSLRINVSEMRTLGATLPYSAIKLGPSLPFDEFVKSLKSEGNKPVVIWVHGYMNSFKTSTAYYAQIANDLNIDASFISYDWASNNSLLGYNADIQQISQSAGNLADLLETIVNKVRPKKVIIIAHSLGCRLVCEAFDELYKKPRWSDKDTEFEHVIFLAPNVEKNEFDNRFKDELASMVKKLTVYVASDDGALLVSKMLYHIDSLGLPGQFFADTQLDEIQALLYYSRHLPNRVEIIDVSFFPRKGFTRHLYFTDRPVLHDLYDLIARDEPADVRYLLRYSSDKAGRKAHVGYWIIPP